MRKNSGFSVVELVVVIVISGVLAAVAVPLNSNTTTNAIMSEADAGLKVIETQLRIYKAMAGEYPTMSKGSYVISGDWHGIKAGELTGKYFSDYAYTIESTPESYTVTCVTGKLLSSDLVMKSVGIAAGG
ncbi:MAG: prepilin-type N-terminal cleavage/methylation domain-containing protein [Candidatus Marinimicrobia bacterium]|nr:prepilin-type N-terminal cleavage/methylation domain-containing protein [Candidatus Neomarinimicrobiota bacterium]MCF7850897.1 prepilin-type N-terminal cleavage/methylation domain-containing protein [Candidatus Neomarinimicrobiota bacterium]MCF7905179.1 prepilin-type N-terminal cleavage/methylation domain-containing protein [Candidatus Neomarinimicrobiota bacterium]